MVKQLIKKISTGSRFNQIYMKKNEGFGFEPGKTVLITPLTDVLAKDIYILEYHVVLNNAKKEIAKTIFRIIDSHGGYDNLIITGSFLDEGFNFEDIDILIIDAKEMDKDAVKDSIEQAIGVKAHLVFIDSEILNSGIKRDPLFLLMLDRYISTKRMILKKDREINYKLLDAYLVKNKNLIEGYDLFDIKQRKKLLRDFISIKLFAENKEVTIKKVEEEIKKVFGKDIIGRLFYYGDLNAKQDFLEKLKNEFKKLENKVIKNYK